MDQGPGRPFFAVLHRGVLEIGTCVYGPAGQGGYNGDRSEQSGKGRSAARNLNQGGPAP